MEDCSKFLPQRRGTLSSRSQRSRGLAALSHVAAKPELIGICTVRRAALCFCHTLGLFCRTCWVPLSFSSFVAAFIRIGSVIAAATARPGKKKWRPVDCCNACGPSSDELYIQHHTRRPEMTSSALGHVTESSRDRSLHGDICMYMKTVAARPNTYSWLL